MNNNFNPAEITEVLNKIISALSAASSTGINIISGEQEKLKNTREISTYFSYMLSVTKDMAENMSTIDKGFAGTAELIIKLLSSIAGGSSSGIGGIFSGVLGIIGGILGGPLGAAAGSGLGGILGGTSFPVIPFTNTVINQPPQIQNNITIKNPVTFHKAFDVEVRTRELRGGIDL